MREELIARVEATQNHLPLEVKKQEVIPRVEAVTKQEVATTEQIVLREPVLGGIVTCRNATRGVNSLCAVIWQAVARSPLTREIVATQPTWRLPLMAQCGLQELDQGYCIQIS